MMKTVISAMNQFQFDVNILNFILRNVAVVQLASSHVGVPRAIHDSAAVAHGITERKGLFLTLLLDYQDLFRSVAGRRVFHQLPKRRFYEPFSGRLQF